ncbi:MAG: peptidase dimerization domain-containing protein [Pseudomonadota bacterium]
MTDLVSNSLQEIGRSFDEEALPSLSEFIRIRNLSPAFDPEGEATANTHAALEHVANWAADHAPDGSAIKTLTHVEHAPLLVIDIPGTVDGTVICYGHLDKQPADSDWSAAESGYTPVLRDGKLFGRGGVDGGFAPYCYVSAIATLDRLGIAHPRCIIILETTEKSHSIHLPRYFPDLRAACDTPDLIIALDSICADYDRIWYMQGYRGVIDGNLTIAALDKDAHSGAAGMAPSTVGIGMELLNRVCDLPSGLMKLDSFRAQKPRHLTTGGAETDAIAGRYFLRSAGVTRDIPTITDDPAAAASLPVWHSSLTIAGIQGLSSTNLTGGVLPSEVTIKIAVRTPPGHDSVSAAVDLEEALVADPPLNAAVDFSPSSILSGWRAGELPSWLKTSLDDASRTFFGNAATGWSIGGAYPEIEIIAQEFEDVPILMTGVQGPDSNFQDANESLDIPAAHKMTASIAKIFADFAGSSHRV